MNLHLSRSVSLTALLLSSTAAFAQEESADPGRLSGYATVGVAATPDYEGADDHRIVPLVDARVYLGDRYLALEATSLRANILNTRDFEFGPVASLTFGRDDDIKNRAVARLGKIDDAYEVGAFGAVSFDIAGNDRVRFAVQGVHDISDTHRGWVVSASASYTAQVGDRARLIFDLGSSYASDDYADSYFSVTPAGSVASGLSAFTAKGGIKDVGGSVTASYRIGPNWGIAANAGYRRMLGDFANSPAVADGGNPDQLSGGIGVFYAF